MEQDNTRQIGISRRTVLQRGAVASTLLGLGLTTATGQVAAMNKAELIEAVASDAGISKADAKRALDGFIDATTKALKNGDRVSWDGFGSFSISKRSARTGRNPQTGKEIQTSAGNVVKFKAGAELTAALDLVPGEGDERRLARRQQKRQEERTDRSRDGTLIDADRLAREADVARETAETFLDAFIDATTKALKKGDRLSLIGFGSFRVSKRSARTGRNPQTGKEIQIPARNVVKFKAGAELSKAIN